MFACTCKANYHALIVLFKKSPFQCGVSVGNLFMYSSSSRLILLVVANFSAFRPLTLDQKLHGCIDMGFQVCVGWADLGQ